MAGAAKKFNLTELLNQRSKEAGEQQKTEQQQAAAGAEVVTSEEGVSSTADIYDLIPSKGNFYSVEDVQDLKQSIELLGVLQPLLVTDEEEDGTIKTMRDEAWCFQFVRRNGGAADGKTNNNA